MVTIWAREQDQCNGRLHSAHSRFDCPVSIYLCLVLASLCTYLALTVLLSFRIKLTKTLHLSCAMGTRFNSFYKEELHPFVGAMVGLLVESGNRSRRPHVADYFFRSRKAQYDQNLQYIRQMAKELIDNRRAHPSEKKDLLNAMLYNKDPQTGEGLSDDAIVNNMITFLIAGTLIIPVNILLC